MPKNIPVIEQTYPAKLFDPAAARLQPYYELRRIAAMKLNTFHLRHGGEDSTYVTLGDIKIRYADHANVSEFHWYPDYNCVNRDLTPAELAHIERRLRYPANCRVDAFALHVGLKVSELKRLLTHDCYEAVCEKFRYNNLFTKYVRVERALAKLTAEGIVDRFPVARERGVKFTVPVITSLRLRCQPCNGSGSIECSVCRCRRCSGKGKVDAPCLCRSGRLSCSACAGTGRKKTRVLLIFQREVPCLQCAGVGWYKCPSCRDGKIMVQCPICKRGDQPCACGGSAREKCTQCGGTGIVDFIGALQRLQVVAQWKETDCGPYRAFNCYVHSAMELLAALDGVDSKYKFQDADETRLRLTSTFDDGYIRLDFFRVTEDRFWVLRFDSRRGALNGELECAYQELPPECLVLDHPWRPGGSKKRPPRTQV